MFLKHLFTPLHCVLLTLLLIFSVAAPAQAISVETLQKQIDQLDPEDQSADSKALRDLYQQTQAALSAQEQYQQQIEDLNKEIQNQPRELEKLRRSLNTPLPDLPRRVSNNAPLNELEQVLTVRKAELVKQQQERDALSEAISESDDQLLKLREQLSDVKQDSAEPIRETDSDTAEVQAAANQLQEAREKARSAQVQALELQILAHPSANELDQLRLSSLKREITRLQTRINDLQESVKQRRRNEIEDTLQELQKAEGKDVLPPQLSDAQQVNIDLSKELRGLLDALEESNTQHTRLNRQFDQIKQNYRLIRQQLDLEVQHMSGSNLRAFTRDLVSPTSTEEISNRINQERLRNLELNQQELRLEELIRQANQKPDELTDSEWQAYKQLLSDRLNVINSLHDNRQQLINELSENLSLQEQINEQITLARQLIDQRLLWIPTVAPLSLSWFGDIRTAFDNISDTTVKYFSNTQFIDTGSLFIVIAGTLFTLLLAVLSNRYERQNKAQWHKNVGKVMHDHFRYSLFMLFNAFLKALPLPVLLWLSAEHLINTEHPAHEVTTTVLKIISLATLLYSTLRNSLRAEDGLATVHLGIPEQLVRVLRREIHALYWAGLPLLVMVMACDVMDQGSLMATFGRLFFIGMVLVLIRFWWVFWKMRDTLNELNSHPDWWNNPAIWTGFLLLFNVVLLLMGLSGYLLTSLFFMLMMTLLLMLLVAAFVTYRLGVRYLLIAERRMAFTKAKARRAELIEARENHEEEPLKEDYIDLQTVSDQARAALKLICVIMLGTSIWLALGRFLPTLNILDSIELWDSLTTGPNGDVVKVVTLGDVVGGLLILSLSILAAYNLPGVLELLMLRHLSLSPGSNYAITTLTKYILILLGVIVGIAQFGVEWSKLQWLVAALGVGLGFGLQEVVANFISGLIILFEKPYRIGDIVTIGNMTGSVTRIQIRATTLLDFDNKEVIIPNKSFITERLINWSLTDGVTRVVILVGVAYGTKPETVRKLLLQAATEQEVVLKDPEPYAYFREFGDSTLNFNLNLYVSNIGDRIPTTHAVNMRIAELFEENDIEIAFPQLDLHLRTNEAGIGLTPIDPQTVKSNNQPDATGASNS